MNIHFQFLSVSEVKKMHLCISQSALFAFCKVAERNILSNCCICISVLLGRVVSNASIVFVSFNTVSGWYSKQTMQNFP